MGVTEHVDGVTATQKSLYGGCGIITLVAGFFYPSMLEESGIYLGRLDISVIQFSYVHPFIDIISV